MANLIHGQKDGKKVSAKGLRHLINAIGRKIFSRVHRAEVEYGQTLSKKRRKNCVLKSVSTLSRTVDEDEGCLIQSPYRINFRFARDEGFGMCCDKCDLNLRRGESLSRFSVSSDSACDVSSSQSSCDDVNCEYRKNAKMVRVKKSQSSDDVTRHGPTTVDHFIRVHSENFKSRRILRQQHQQLLDDEEEDDATHSYESLANGDDAGTVEDFDYDILLTKSGYHVAEPFYENLKVVEAAQARDLSLHSRNVVQSHKTYDGVIESLKIWHKNSRNDRSDMQQVENALNHCLEGYESLENELNNDIEEFCWT